MVGHEYHGDTGEPVTYSLLFPDGSLSFVDDAEVSKYFENRKPQVGKNGRGGNRSEFTEAVARQQNLAALLYSDGGITQVQIDEIPEFFHKRWVISTRGIISVRKALKLSNNGVIGKTAISPTTVNELTDGNLSNGGKSQSNVIEVQECGLSNRKLLASLGKEGADNNKNMVMTSQAINCKKQMTMGAKEIIKNDNQSTLNRESGSGIEKIITDNTIGLIVPQQELASNVKTAVTHPDIDGNGKKKEYVKPKGWASLFGSNRNAEMGFKVPEIFDGVTKDGVFLREEHIQPDVFQGLRLVGYFTPRFPGPEALAKVVNSWSSPNCKFYHHRSNWTVFTFDNELEMNRVLENGPYFAFGMTLYIKKMPPLFEFDWVDHTLLPVWVQLPSLPIDLWNWECLGRICTYIGTPQQADEATKAKDKLSFARVLVEVDVSIKLPSKIPVHLPQKSFMQSVLYEDVPKFCTKCKKMGHVVEICTSEKPSEPTLYVSRAAKKYKEKFPLRHGQETLNDSEGWIVQGRRHKKIFGYQSQTVQNRNGNHISNDTLNQINADKDLKAKEEAEKRISQGNSQHNMGNSQGEATGERKWVPTGNINKKVHGGNRSNQAQVKAGENYHPRNDVDKELVLKRQQAQEISCTKNSFDPLKQGNRTKEWGLCEQDELEPTFDCRSDFDQNNSELNDKDNEESESEEGDDLGENDIISGNEDDTIMATVQVNVDPREKSTGLAQGKNTHLERNSTVDLPMLDKKNKNNNPKVMDKSCTATVTTHSNPADTRNKNLMESKDPDKVAQEKQELKAAKRKSKKERKAQRTVNGGNASNLTP